MKTYQSFFSIFRAACVSVMLVVLFAALTARAGLTVNIHLYHDAGGYFFYPWLSTNDTPPAVSEGMYRIQSPQQPTNGTWLLYEALGGSFSQLGGNPTRQYDFDSHLDAITNGLWSIWVTNSIATNEFKFAVTVSGFTSNSFGAPAIVLYPAEGNTNVANKPLFTWSGPANWAGTLQTYAYSIDEFEDYNFQAYADLPPDSTSWLCPVILPDGPNEFSVYYSSNATAFIVASTPTNDASQPVSGWISTATLTTYNYSEFGVSGSANDFNQYLVARYDFEDINDRGADTSGNENHANCWSTSGPQEDTDSTDAAVGVFSREFLGDTAICLTPDSQAYSNLSNALTGDFTVSAWVKTTTTFGWDGSEAQFGAGIFFPYTSETNSVAPLSMIGGKLGFTIKDEEGTPTTIRSTSDINDGSFHFVSVTRNRITGVIKLYVDGQLQADDIGPTMPVICHSNSIYIGKGDFERFIGLVDDLRIYSVELSEQELGILFGGQVGSGAVAHYNFDDSESYPQDVSGNGNHIDYSFGFSGGDYFSTSESIAGAASVGFYKDSENSNSGGMLGWNPMPPSLMSTLAASFSISVWVKTSNETGTAGQNAADGACIVVADVPGSARDLTPIALTGGHVAFTTGGEEGDDTLTSDEYVSDDSWHHIVVTRDQITGEKRLYIDGVEDAGSPTTGSTDLLDEPNFLSIGVRMDASAPDADSAIVYSSHGYEGLLDDLQFYNRVITPEEVVFLNENPGQELSSGGGGPTLADALDNDLLEFTTGGNSPWIYQTVVTFDTEDAAASGTIGDGQASWMETTAPVDGNISFRWKVSSAFGDYVGFFINGVQWDNIWGDVDWQSSSHPVNAGDVLRWEYYKNGSGSEGDDKAWVDQVTFDPDLAAPVLTLRLELYREQILGLGERYYSFPSVVWTSPFPLTTNRLTSPTGKFTATKTPTSSGSGAIYVPTLDALINECTNGVWTIYINKDSAFEQIYTFSVSITNLDTSLLDRVHILSPTNGLVNVRTNATFHWTGPTGFESVSVKKFMPPNGANEVFAELPGTATNWPSPPALIVGVNNFHVRYQSNNVPQITITTPEDIFSQPVSGWLPSASLISSATVEFEVVDSAPPQPAQITGVHRTGGSLQFSFTTQDGLIHTIEARTNLTSGTWIELTNFTGDGNLQQFTFPTTNPAIRYFRVKTE